MDPANIPAEGADENLRADIRRELHLEQERQAEQNNNNERPDFDGWEIPSMEQILAHFAEQHAGKMARLGIDPMTIFSAQDIITLALRPDLREAFMNAFVERNIKLLAFDLSHIQAAMDHLANAIPAVKLSIGLYLFFHSLSRMDLEKIAFTDGVASHPSWVATITSHCPQIPKMWLYFHGEAPVDMNLDWIAERETQLIGLHGILLPTLRIFSQNLANMPSLLELSIEGTGGSDGSPMIIGTARNAQMLQTILSLPKVERLGLSKITLTTCQATASFCDSLASSRLKSCILSDIVYPESAVDLVVDALVQSPLVKLAYSMPHIAQDHMYGPICRGISRSSTLTSLTLGDPNFREFLDCDDIVDWLGDQGQWSNLQCLSLSLRNWNANFEKYLSGFVRNQCLQKLYLHFPANFDGPSRAPEELIAAADEGKQCLEEIEVTQKSDDPGLVLARDISETWCLKLQPILVLNRQRRIQRPKIAAMEQAAADSDQHLRRTLLVEVLEALDMPPLFGFLQRNEWHLQELIKELAVAKETMLGSATRVQ